MHKVTTYTFTSAGVFENNNYIHIPVGFVVPTFRDGGLYVADITDGSKVEIANGKIPKVIVDLVLIYVTMYENSIMMSVF